MLLLVLKNNLPRSFETPPQSLHACLAVFIAANVWQKPERINKIILLNASNDN
jgi:hypothetical protein